MDRKIEKGRWNKKRILTIAGITGLALLIFASIFFTSGKSKLNVDVEREHTVRGELTDQHTVRDHEERDQREANADRGHDGLTEGAGRSRSAHG